MLSIRYSDKYYDVNGRELPAQELGQAARGNLLVLDAEIADREESSELVCHMPQLLDKLRAKGGQEYFTLSLAGTTFHMFYDGAAYLATLEGQGFSDISPQELEALYGKPLRVTSSMVSQAPSVSSSQSGRKGRKKSKVVKKKVILPVRKIAAACGVFLALCILALGGCYWLDMQRVARGKQAKRDAEAFAARLEATIAQKGAAVVRTINTPNIHTAILRAINTAPLLDIAAWELADKKLNLTYKVEERSVSGVEELRKLGTVTKDGGQLKVQIVE